MYEIVCVKTGQVVQTVSIKEFCKYGITEPGFYARKVEKEDN